MCELVGFLLRQSQLKEDFCNLDLLLSIAVDKSADTIPEHSETDSINLLIESNYFWTTVGVERS